MIRRPIFFPGEAVGGVVKVLHDSPMMVAIHVTGAFTGLAQMLWDVPGASRTLLDYDLSYSRAATIKALGRNPEKFCTAETARLMADKAYERAVHLAVADKDVIPFKPNLLGFGATASTATGREKKGADRFHIAIRSKKRLWSFSAEFVKGLTRAEQGKICDTISLAMLARVAAFEPAGPGLEQLSFRGYTSLLATQDLRLIEDGWETVVPSVREVEDIRFEEMLAKPLQWLDGRRSDASELSPVSHAIFPGSFNPLHAGHFAMAEAVRKLTSKEVVYSICVEHPDKGRLGVDDVANRLKRFEWVAPVILTRNDPLYVEKARAFPRFSFVIGADTVRRLLDPKYYGGEAGRDRMLAELFSLGTIFLVFDRQMPDGFVRLDDLPIPVAWKEMFARLEGRWDVSSTQIRNARQKKESAA